MQKNRYREIVFEVDEGINLKFLDGKFKAEEGTAFKISEREDGALIIRALNDRTTGNVYSDNYVNPPIPEGYKHVEGEWNNGFVIERCSDGSQFVWVPVGMLDSDGTLDGDRYSEKFGRRNYLREEFGYRYAEATFSEEEFHEELGEELLEQLESVKKYGGFYISRFNISKNSSEKPLSVRGAKPWIPYDFDEAKKMAAVMENSDEVKSHLTFGAEYDSVLAWFIKSNARTYDEIINKPEEWGYYCKQSRYWSDFWKDYKYTNVEVVKTGSCEKWCTNNIYDFSGNVAEWTQEVYGEPQVRYVETGEFEGDWANVDTHVIRGEMYNFACDGNGASVAARNYEEYCKYTGFRVALCIK